MRSLVLGMMALGATPAMAQSYGGGGIVVQQSALDWQVPDQRTVNAIGCIGGMGYGVTDGKRKGGEGHYCSGPYAMMAMGGVHFGLQGKRAGSWLMAYNTVGAGWVGVQGPSSGRFDGVFAYTRPSVGGGLAVSPWAALEGSAFLTLPVNIVGVVGRDMDAKVFFPHVGVQATLLFGDFTRKRPVQENPMPVDEDAPLAIPGGRPPPPREGPRTAPKPAPAPQPSGPLRPGDLPPADGGDEEPEEGPLAIPG
ncbi:MAG: hypothetical protein H6736_22925 [Alphaproteobacteria bacterium]|nr:hypothetical protein [Alphaproteobacteria bacterium]MCB9694675.1 hypothetical protein [Alphaproteobacteria bacterium]